ncbi:MAG: hypothetical protein U5K54_23920, partial [Cytophagales bacterium]|nr:hypothetical protein [Cytophagales bacterium]
VLLKRWTSNVRKSFGFDSPQALHHIAKGHRQSHAMKQSQRPKHMLIVSHIVTGPNCRVLLNT